jgi:hypothetical protein
VARDGSATPVEEGTYRTSSGNDRKKQTTAGWHLTVSWKNGETSEVPLKDLKASYPIQLAEYAVANRVDGEPAFAWWVPYTLEKRDRIIAKAKSRYWKRTHKFGIELPKSLTVKKSAPTYRPPRREPKLSQRVPLSQLIRVDHLHSNLGCRIRKSQI